MAESTTDRVMNEVGGQKFDSVIDALNSINRHVNRVDENFQRLVNGKGFQSQGNARDTRDSAGSTGSQRPFGDHHANFRYNSNRPSGGSGKDFAGGFERGFYDALGGSEFKKRLQKSLNRFATTLGTDIEGLGDAFGEQMGKVMANSIKSSPIGKKVTDKLNSAIDKAFSQEGSINDLLNKLKDPNADFDTFADGIKNIDLGKFGNLVKNGSMDLLKGINKFTGGIGGPLIAMKAFEIATEGATEVLSGFDDLLKVFSVAANRYSETRKKNLEAANKRLEADVHTLVEQPFKLLQQAATDVYNAWNENIRLITGTQGYTKADLQDLMSAYAQRIQSEGLSNVIPATDVYNNLAKVIQAGLSGNAAVEFAYQATKYGAAIPSQDFFNYVESYASVAANAIAAGKSEAEALQIANRSLEDFANNLLYASRNLTGGYSTGLKAADSIYASAVKIAQAAKSENINQISSSLLAIQGYVGSIAPDLATTLSDKIYQLVTGGNNADIVALRSLAGIGASNTEFIRAFSQNPQAVLSTMFANLGKMFTESADAYMEKAEGYASLFGLSSEAFQRVDFMSLANAVSNMDSNTNTLEENLKLLEEGQTTTTTEQLKIAQINKYMVEEGLAYVIDNEAAQMIQQHMWDEQLAREMTEATYGVELVGGALEALQKILGGIDKVLSLINPIAWISKIANIVETTVEGVSENEDIKRVLEKSLVGTGNRADLYNLTNRNRDLKLTKTLIELMGGESATTGYRKGWVSQAINALGHPLEGLYDLAIGHFGNWAPTSTPTYGNLPSSQYSGFTTSKSTAALARAILSSSNAAEQVTHEVVSNVTGVISASSAMMKSKIDKMLSDEYLSEKFIKQGKTYSDWLASANQMGVADMEAALEDAGYSSTDVEEYFKAKQTEAGMAEKLAQAEEEKLFKQSGIDFWTVKFWSDYSTPLTTKFDTLISLHTGWRDTQLEKLQNIIKGQIDWRNYFETTWIENTWKTDFVGESGYFTKFFDEFVKKFVEHTYYDESGYSYKDVVEVQRKEKAEQGDAVYALAEALTGNLVDLKDPQVQTNAILAQILVVVSAIMNQNNNPIGTTSIAETLAGMALGLTTETPLNETPYMARAK